MFKKGEKVWIFLKTKKMTGGRFSSPEPSPEKTGCSPPRVETSNEIPIILGNDFDVQAPEYKPEVEEPQRKKAKVESTPIRGRKWDERPLSNRPRLDSSYVLPDGWTKTVVTRKSGASAGVYDVYLTPPKGKRLRSNNDILRFAVQNPNVPLDPDFVNMEPPIDENGVVIHSMQIEVL